MSGTISTSDRVEILEMKRRGYTASQIKQEFEKRGTPILWLELVKIYNERNE